MPLRIGPNVLGRRRRASGAIDAPEPLEIAGSGLDVHERLCEPGLFVVGELDVAGPEQLNRLRLLGADLGQGFLFWKPMDREAVESLLREASSLAS
jgi:hypothetical protein